MNATAKDMRFHSKDLLDTVSRGEEVVITYRGRPCAKLVPISIETRKPAKNELFGIWRDQDRINPDEYVRNLRKGRF